MKPNRLSGLRDLTSQRDERQALAEIQGLGLGSQAVQILRGAGVEVQRTVRDVASGSAQQMLELSRAAQRVEQRRQEAVEAAAS